MYAIVETNDNGVNCVTAVPKRWIIGNILYWPNTIVVLADRQKPKDPVVGVWSEHAFVMLKDNISNFR